MRLEAVTIQATDQTWPEKHDPFDDSRVIQACLNLVVLQDDDAIHFTHAMSKQFLLSIQGDSEVWNFGFDPSRASMELGEVCITYCHFWTSRRKSAAKTHLCKCWKPQSDAISRFNLTMQQQPVYVIVFVDEDLNRNYPVISTISNT